MTIEFESPGIRCWHNEDGALVVTLDGERPTISEAVLDAYHRAIALAEARFEMLVIGEGQKDFAYGADLGDGLSAAIAGDTAPLDRLLHYYQQTMLALRHARVPTIAVSRGVAVSGGCEVLMHCTRVVATPKSPIGLAEASIGVMPAGGGVKEMARRTALRGIDGYTANLERAFSVLSGARIAYARDAKPFDLLTEHDVIVRRRSAHRRQATRAYAVEERLQTAGAQSADPRCRLRGARAIDCSTSHRREHHAAPAPRERRYRPRAVRRRRRRARGAGTDVCSIWSAATSSSWCKRR